MVLLCLVAGLKAMLAEMGASREVRMMVTVAAGIMGKLLVVSVAELVESANLVGAVLQNVGMEVSLEVSFASPVVSPAYLSWLVLKVVGS